MSDPALLQHVSLTQGDRFLFRRVLLRRLNVESIDRLSTNIHIVPASDAVADALEAIRRGSLLTLRGKLVDVREEATGRDYRSSLSRLDRGAGACEILYLESLQLQDESP